ncbi:MAG: cell division protein FtsL [Clostridiales bacterium]|nr:cell division protein FtsL [Clostridiales bacterium]
MTNTGDFRRYSYTTDAAYALKAFDVDRKSSAAPEYVPRKKRDLKVHENPKKKSMHQLLQEQRLGFAQVVKIVIIAVVSVSMLVGVLYTYATKNELTREISELEEQLEISESENTRITSELDALVSVSMIDQYAVEQLGMTKVSSSQICYIDVSQYKEERLAAAQMLLQSDDGSEDSSEENSEETVSQADSD